MSKAELPSEGRIAIFDSINEASLNSIANLVTVDSNPRFEGLINTGFSRNQKFMFNIFGFDIYVSERLPRVASESIDTTTIAVPAPSGAATVTSGASATSSSPQHGGVLVFSARSHWCR